MQTENERDETKVISIADRNQKRSETTTIPEVTPAAPSPNKAEEFDWSSIVKRNNENSSRMQQDRSKSNKGVIRSYRLKH